LFNNIYVELFTNFCARVITLLAIAYTLSPSVVQACEKPVYTIGVQAIEYSPHYNFEDKNAASYFSEYVAWLNNNLPCRFIVKPYPIKRLNLLFNQKQVDFIYPDNPNWHDEITAQSRSYSTPLVTALGGTVVKLKDKDIELGDFKRLAFPRGFTPIAWLELQAQYIIEFAETNSAKAALQMVLSSRASGADVEWNVANYLIKVNGLKPMTLGRKLPFTPTKFHLATL